MNTFTLEMFDESSDEESAYEFASDIEQKAAELEVTCDYYLMEFI
jgi:hypothetical protein